MVLRLDDLRLLGGREQVEVGLVLLVGLKIGLERLRRWLLGHGLALIEIEPLFFMILDHRLHNGPCLTLLKAVAGLVDLDEAILNEVGDHVILDG